MRLAAAATSGIWISAVVTEHEMKLTLYKNDPTQEKCIGRAETVWF
jgi:hypothetical protein